MWLDPDLYDAENADDPGFDLGYWQRLVRDAAPRRLLELACGTGRLTLPLARLGVAEELVALDSSAPFIARLRELLDTEVDAVSRTVRVIEGEMQRPEVEGRFDLIIVPFNSLAYLITREDRLACLRAVRALLAPGGRFAFDIVQPHYAFLAESIGSCPPLRVDADHSAPQFGISRFLRSYSDVYDPRTQTLRSTNRYEIHYADGRVEHRIGDLDWHIYFPEELSLLLETAGLATVQRYGDYDRGPWTPASRRYLWVTEAR